MSINTVTLMGRLTAAPELKATPNGVSVTPFSVAVDRKYTASGQERQTDFIECVAWRQTAEFISKYFRKGDMIAIEGELQTRTYEDKNGNKRKAVDVVVSTVSFCGGKKSETTQRKEGQPCIDINEDDVDNGFVVINNVETDDDLPF